MADDTALNRLKVRLTTLSEVPTDEELGEIVRGLSDRVCMRLRVRTLPDLAESVVVDAAVKVPYAAQTEVKSPRIAGSCQKLKERHRTVSFSETLEETNSNTLISDF